jgi:hypothetical protein
MKKMFSFSSNSLYLLGFVLFVFCTISVCNAQHYIPDVCNTKGVSCNDVAERTGIIYSFKEQEFSYSAVGTSMPFWLAIGDVSTQTIDSTYAGTVSAAIISGPGTLKGAVAVNIWKYAFFNDWIFSASGDYEIEIMVSGFVSDTIKLNVPETFDFCYVAPKGCGSVIGDAVFPLSGNSGIIPVDAIFPINIGVYDRLTGIVDSTFQNYAYVDKVSGPGSIYGTLSMYGSGWFTFNDVHFDQMGTYTLKLRTEGNVIPDTVTVNVVGTNNVKEFGKYPLKVYPNPTSDIFYITGKEGDFLKAIRIFNMQGIPVKNIYNIRASSVKLTDLPVGVYFFEVDIEGVKEIQKGIIIKK